MKIQLLIGATASGSGKTTFMAGILRVLNKRGLKVQAYKCGPDCMDMLYHGAVADCNSVNLDAWISPRTHVQSTYNRYGETADVCIVDGSNGLFDGYKRMQGSSAEMAGILNIPVVLIVNVRSTAYSLAASLYGFKHFYSKVKIAGVVFNHVSSVAHYTFLKELCTDAGLECLGYLPEMENPYVFARYSGLTLAVKRSMNEWADRIAEQMEKTVDVDKILRLCTRIFPCPYTLPYTSEMKVETIRPPKKKLKIAVARDAAFSFILRENLNYLTEVGKVSFFSPLYENDLPEADLIYLPGGYPELFARQLHRRKRMMRQLHDYAADGGKILAEGGGMMLLARSVVTQRGTAYNMADILPWTCTMEHARLHWGYRKTEYKGMLFRGHEFRYFDVTDGDVLFPASDLCRFKNVIASCIHWYWGDLDILKLWDHKM